MINSFDLVALAQRVGVESSAIMPPADARYALPTPGWVEDKLGSALGEALANFPYKPEAWDCDDFAHLAASVAALCWARTEPESDAGLAFGWLYYVTPAGGHAINVACHRDKSGWAYLACYEPQPSPVCLKPITLSAEQWRSVFCLRF